MQAIRPIACQILALGANAAVILNRALKKVVITRRASTFEYFAAQPAAQ